MQIPSPIPLHRNKRFRRTLIAAASCCVGENSAAGDNITARAAQVDAGGDLTAQAGGNIAISAGQASQTVDDRYYRRDSGFLSSSRRTIEDFVHQTSAQASSLGRETITFLQKYELLRQVVRLKSSKTCRKIARIKAV